MLCRPFAAAAALFFALPAAAQSIDCDNAMTQSDMNACAQQSWMEADAALNEVYAEAMAMLKGWDEEQPDQERSGADALRDAQRAWIPFRDAACELEGWPMRGGSAEPLLVYGCRESLTRERIAALEGLLAYQ